ncbi:hypothetical protein [Parachlamydia sp. AcF125]|uniref:hypothetical protein n=1 Tax=Parachlamydia sp. AcF125 TaxID=2795736 RepID=UPI001BC94E8D|nr:hypothetical protein [Parachlamydia sp. AcF125]MBS4168972.1 hypothetical protein [Parachlamydia sp. AcF125]
MKADKTLIMLALVIILAAFIFRGKIVEEVQLLKEVQESSKLIEGLPAIYFYHLPQKVKVELLCDHIEKMKATQKRISKSIFVKYFVDLLKYIMKCQKELFEQQERLNYEEGCISLCGNRD